MRVRVREPVREASAEARLGEDVVVPREHRADGHDVDVREFVKVKRRGRERDGEPSLLRRRTGSGGMGDGMMRWHLLFSFP